MFERLWRERSSFTLLVGMEIGAATMENHMELLQKLKIKLPYDPTIHSWIYIQNNNKNNEKIHNPIVHSSTTVANV